MNRIKRYIIQTLLWFGVWCILYVFNGNETDFIKKNIATFIFQSLVLYGFIYLIVPKFLFKKKYLYFVCISLGLILSLAAISSKLDSIFNNIKTTPNMDMLHGTEAPPHMERSHLKPPHQDHHPETNFNRDVRPRHPSLFFIHFLLLSICGLFAVVLETFVFALKKENDEAITKAELMEIELKFLKMQINPHFLFNALNNIYALSVTNSNKTQESISTLSGILRYVLYDCEQPKVYLKNEIDYIKNYIDLFNLKSNKKFEITFSENIIDEHIMIAPMLFVPYIENAFKHSGIEKGLDRFIKISITQKGNNINFLIKNSIPKKQIVTDSKGGIGIQNVQKRLEILYPKKHQLKITNSSVFEVNLKIEI